MREEIKEILQELENMYEISELEEQVNNINKIKDYITNLQEENERLKEDITTMNDYIGKIQKENNILKENAEHNDKVVDKAKWNEMIYKSRIDKAIEYLKDENNIIDLFTKHDFRKYPDYNVFGIDKPQENINCVELYGYDDLLNLLQGVDKE